MAIFFHLLLAVFFGGVRGNALSPADESPGQNHGLTGCGSVSGAAGPAAGAGGPWGGRPTLPVGPVAHVPLRRSPPGAPSLGLRATRGGAGGARPTTPTSPRPGPGCLNVRGCTLVSLRPISTQNEQIWSVERTAYIYMTFSIELEIRLLSGKRCLLWMTLPGTH